LEKARARCTQPRIQVAGPDAVDDRCLCEVVRKGWDAESLIVKTRPGVLMYLGTVYVYGQGSKDREQRSERPWSLHLQFDVTHPGTELKGVTLQLRIHLIDF